MKVSIIVPIYNVEQYLAKCIDSLVNQTLKNIEIILINDCSPDNSEEIILNYQKKDDRIVYLKQKVNQGQGYARNLGISIAKGEYILFVDSDDYIELNSCELLYENAKKLNLDVLEGGYIIENGDNRDNREVHNDKGVYTGPEYFENINKVNSIVWNKLWRRNFILNHKLLFTKMIYEDSLFISKSMQFVNRMSTLNICFYHYIIRENSTMTKSFTNKNIHAILFLIENLEIIYLANVNKKGSDLNFKKMMYGLSTLSSILENYNGSDLKLVSDSNTYLKSIHLKYKKNIFKCNKIGLVQKIFIYISPSFLNNLLRFFHIK